MHLDSKPYQNMNIRKNKLLAAVLFFGVVIFFPHPALAVLAPRNFSEFVDIIVGLIKLTVPLVAAISLVAFFWGLVKFIGAAGNEEAIKDGKKIMIWGLIALFVMFSIWGIVSLLNGSLFEGSFGIPQLPV